MPTLKEIEKNLDSIHNWILVSYKKNILKGLQKLLGRDEVVIDLIDGLYRGIKISEKGRELPGVLLLTDSRLLFITNEMSRPLYEDISISDIKEITFEKAISSIIMTIRLKTTTVIFKSFADKVSVRKFIDSIGTKSDKALVSREGKSLKILDEMNDAFTRLVDMADTWLDETKEKEISSPPAPDEEDDLIEDMENLNFLFEEAKKVNRILAEYLLINNDPEFKSTLINDVIILSSLCTFADNKISKEELLFISLVVMPLNPDGSDEVKKQADEIYGFDEFPLHFKSVLLDYQKNLNKYIKNTRPDLDLEKYSLKSLNYLGAQDREGGTNNVDRVGTAFYIYSQCLMKADGRINSDEEERLKQIHLLITRTSTILNDEQLAEEPEKEETLEEVMEKINSLVDMGKIKDQINTFINLIKVQKEREERKLPVTPLSLHAVFYGPPGTGKTTIARLLGKVYKCLGLIKKGHLIETDRAGLVAGYVGQTAINVDKVVNSALDGVLFIDEAYALVPEQGGKDFGQEAINTILKRMEDYRERLVVIVAGYTDEMKQFIYSNPGLKSRFSRYFYFDHYEPENLVQIFDIFCKNVEFIVEEKARIKLLELLKTLYESRDRTFGNGRLVRNLFEQVIERQANRLASIAELTDELLCTVVEEDIPDKDERTG